MPQDINEKQIFKCSQTKMPQEVKRTILYHNNCLKIEKFLEISNSTQIFKTIAKKVNLYKLTFPSQHPLNACATIMILQTVALEHKKFMPITEYDCQKNQSARIKKKINIPALTKNFTDGPLGHLTIHRYKSLCFRH